MTLGDIPERMQKVLEYVKQDVAQIRTGKATPALVENIVINAYGGTAKMKIVELATINVTDASTLVITPYDQSIIGDIRRDIIAANTGLTPVLDNQIIRIAVPMLTGERRAEYVKMLHKKLEDGRVKIRQIRHDKMSEMKKLFEEKTLIEDEKNKLEEDLQKITDKLMEEIERVGAAKELELNTV
jgi:ribosome recycling factor